MKKIKLFLGMLLIAASIPISNAQPLPEEPIQMHCMMTTCTGTICGFKTAEDATNAMIWIQEWICDIYYIDYDPRN